MSFDVSFIYRIVDKYSKRLKGIANNTDRAGKKISRVNSRISKSFGHVATGVGKVGRGIKRLSGLAVGAMAAVAVALIKPIEHARALEAAISDVDKVFNFESAGARTAFIKDLTGLATKLGRTKTEVANLGFEAGKLGIAQADIAKFVELSAQASTALDGLAIEQSGQIIGNLSNRFKLTTIEVEGMLGAINLLADGTTVNGGQILKVVGRMSGQFASLEIPSEVSVGLSAFARQFAETDELAASGMKMFLRELDQVKLSQAPIETITKTLKGLAKLQIGERIASIEEIFGKEASTFVQGLVANVDSLASTMDIVADKTKNAASLQSEFNRKMGTSDQKITNAKNRLIDVSSTIGKAFLPALGVLSDKFIEIAPKIEAFFINNQESINKFTQAFVDSGPMISDVFSFIVTNAERLIAIIGALIDGIKAFANLPGISTILGMVGSAGSFLGKQIDKRFGVGDDGSDNAGIKSLSNISPNSSVAVEGLKAQQQKVQLNGTIGVEGRNGASVSDARVKSSAPGNLGFNLASAGG